MLLDKIKYLRIKYNARHVTNTIQSFFDDNFINVNAKLDTDFCYYFKTRTIGYPLVVMPKFNEAFMDYAEELGLVAPIGAFTLSLLHEIGHDRTYNRLNSDTINYCLDVKDNLGDNFNDTQTYFRLPDEKIATEWAVHYANNHITELVRFEKKLDKRINEFYKKCNITD